MPRTHDVGNDITLAYSTPVLSRVMSGHGAVNEALRILILAHEKESDEVSKSNVGGWHSENDLLKRGSPDVHLVHPHEGPDVRISIAFNARMITVSAPPKRFWKR